MKQSKRIGRRFGKLVVEAVDGRNAHGTLTFRCLCDCGTVVEGVDGSSLYNRKSCGCLKHREPGEVALHNLYLNYAKGARARGLEWALEKDDVRRLVLDDCFYCGSPPSRVQKASHYTDVLLCNGIDRANNAKGYTLENCVSCCEPCNRAKGQMDVDEFIMMAHLISEHHA